MADKWVKRWDVPSSSGTKTYVVAIDADGGYGCSCPHWTNRRTDCRHIGEVKAGIHSPRGEEQTPRPPLEIVVANVREVTPETDEEGQPTGRLLTPMFPIGDTWFQATLVYDLLMAGIPWGVLKKRYEIARRNSLANVVGYVEERGHRIYGPLTTGIGMLTQTYETVPVSREKEGTTQWV